jgi:hypothetical protein
MILLKIITGVAVLIGIVNLFFIFAPQFGGSPDKKRLELLATKSRYSNGRFHNPEDSPVMLPHSIGKVLKKQFSSNPGRIPVNRLPAGQPDTGRSGDDLSVTWFGHSSLLIAIGGKTILIDPVFGKRASPVSFAGPKPFDTEMNFGDNSLPYVDAVIISHDHFDHLDYKTIKRIQSGVSHFLVPLGIRDHLEKWGVPADKIVEFDWGSAFSLTDSLVITSTPAQHFSGRRKQSNATLWCSWVIADPKNRIFFSGDGGYGKHYCRNRGEVRPL